MNILDETINDLFKIRTLKVKPENNLISVLTSLASAGVLIEDRYAINATNDGTYMMFLATDLQWELIKMLLDNMDEFIEKALKESGFEKFEDFLKD